MSVEGEVARQQAPRVSDAGGSDIIALDPPASRPAPPAPTTLPAPTAPPASTAPPVPSAPPARPVLPTLPASPVLPAQRAPPAPPARRAPPAPPARRAPPAPPARQTPPASPAKRAALPPPARPDPPALSVARPAEPMSIAPGPDAPARTATPGVEGHSAAQKTSLGSSAALQRPPPPVPRYDTRPVGHLQVNRDSSPQEQRLGMPSAGDQLVRYLYIDYIYLTLYNRITRGSSALATCTLAGPSSSSQWTVGLSRTAQCQLPTPDLSRAVSMATSPHQSWPGVDKVPLDPPGHNIRPISLWITTRRIPRYL